LTASLRLSDVVVVVVVVVTRLLISWTPPGHLGSGHHHPPHPPGAHLPGLDTAMLLGLQSGRQLGHQSACLDRLDLTHLLRCPGYAGDHLAVTLLLSLLVITARAAQHSGNLGALCHPVLVLVIFGFAVTLVYFSASFRPFPVAFLPDRLVA